MNMEETTLLSKLLDFASTRQQVIANNIANANTPAFTRQELEFRDALARVLKNGDRQGLQSLAAQVVEDHASPAREDGNNVDVGSELGKLMDNSLQHQLLTRVLATKLRILKTAIS